MRTCRATPFFHIREQVPKYCEELLNVPYGRENNLKHVQLYGIVKACSSPKATHGTGMHPFPRIHFGAPACFVRVLRMSSSWTAKGAR